MNEAPKHYDNSKGSLYKVAEERGWNPYLFDIVKRLERAEKKGEFQADLDKTQFLIELYRKEKGVQANLDPVNLDDNCRPLNDLTTALFQFNAAMGIETNETPQFRHSLIAEELNEYLEAAESNNTVQILDALGDLLYVLIGTAVNHNLEHLLFPAFFEIHKSNMTKVDAVTGKVKRNIEGKVMKPMTYQPPNLEKIISKSLRK